MAAARRATIALIAAAAVLVLFYVIEDYPPGSLSLGGILTNGKDEASPMGAWGPVKPGRAMPLNTTTDKVLVTGAAGFIGMVSIEARLTTPRLFYYSTSAHQHQEATLFPP